MTKNELINLFDNLSDKSIAIIVYRVIFGFDVPGIRRHRNLGAGANINYHFSKVKEIIENLEKHDEAISALQILFCDDFRDRVAGLKDPKIDVL